MNLSKALRAGIASLALFGAAPAHSDATPIGPSFLVTTPGTGPEEYGARNLRVAVAPSGAFVVVWTGFSGSPAHEAIYARRFTAGGAAIGPPILVSRDNRRDSYGAAVAWNPAGGFIVVWTEVQIAGPNLVLARRYNNAGVPQESIPKILALYGSHDPQVVTNADGAFVVVWTDETIDAPGVYGPVGRAFSPNGTPKGLPFRLAARQDGYRSDARIALTADGGFAAAWQEFRTLPFKYGELNTESSGVYLRHFTIDGTPKDGVERRIDTSTAGIRSSAGAPTIAPDFASGYVVSWSDATHFLARRFVGIGGSVDPVELVVGDTHCCQGQTKPYALGYGALAGQSASGASVFAYLNPLRELRGRRFAPSGQPVDASDFRLDDSPVPTSPFNDRIQESVLGAQPGGGFVVAWIDHRLDGPTGRNRTIRARVFAP